MNSTAADHTFDKRVKERQSLHDVGQREQLEQMQAEVRHNNELLTTLRRENKELRTALQQSQRGQANVNIDDHYEKEEELLQNKTAVLKRSLNAVKAKNTELIQEVEKAQQEDDFVKQEGGRGLDENSPIAQKIRALENRLDKCLVKHNEVNAIRQTYETLLERLQLEQSGFDTQLSSTEKALQLATKELGDLTQVGSHSAKERDQAKGEVARLKAKLAEERKTQRKDIDEKRGFVQEKRDGLERKHVALMQKMAQQEDRHARALATASTTGTKKRSNRSNNASVALQQEELEKIEALKESYQRLKDITVGQNVADVIRKYQERVESNESLQHAAEALQGAIEVQRSQKEELHGAWENASRRAGGAMVSARTTRAARDTARTAPAAGDDAEDGEGAPSGGVAGKDFRLMAERPREHNAVVSEFEGHLQERETELREAQQKHDALTQVLADVDMGVQHLAEKLAVGHGKEDDSATAAKQQAAALDAAGVSVILRNAAATSDLLRNCDTKLQMMLEGITEADIAEAARVMTTSKVIIPESNIRVPALVAALRDQDDDDAEEGRGGKGQPGAKGGARGGGALLPPAPQLDEFPDNDIHNRHELKMMSRAAVEREEKKARKQQQQRRKEETV